MSENIHSEFLQSVADKVRPLKSHSDIDKWHIRAEDLGSICIPQPLRSELLRKYVWDRPAFVKRCILLAQDGSPDAVAIVSLIAYNSPGQRRHQLAEARRWAEIADGADNPLGSYVLGLTYMEGREYEMAVHFLERAVARSFGPAAWVIGKLSEEGIGVCRDTRKAARYYHLASKCGYLFGGLSYSNVVRAGALGFLPGLKALLLLPFATVRFHFRNRFSARVDASHLFPKNMILHIISAMKDKYPVHE